MKNIRLLKVLMVMMVALVLLAGCGSSKVTTMEQLISEDGGNANSLEAREPYFAALRQLSNTTASTGEEIITGIAQARRDAKAKGTDVSNLQVMQGVVQTAASMQPMPSFDQAARAWMGG